MQKVKTQQKCFNFLEDFKLSVSQQLTVFNFYLLLLKRRTGGCKRRFEQCIAMLKIKWDIPYPVKQTTYITDTSDKSNTRNARNTYETGI